MRADEEDVGLEVNIWSYGERWRKERRIVPDPDNAQTSGSLLSFSPDGTLLGVGLNDGRIHILDSRTGALLRRIGEVFGDQYVYAFSADWTRVVAAAGEEGPERRFSDAPDPLLVRVYNVQTGHRCAQLLAGCAGPGVFGVRDPCWREALQVRQMQGGGVLLGRVPESQLDAP